MPLKSNILAGILAGAGGSDKLQVGFAATGGRIGYGRANPTQSGGSRYCFVVRAPIQITADCEWLEFHWDNQYFQNTTLTANGSNRELVAYALEKFDGSSYAPITFDNGSINKIIAPNGHATSDRLYPSAFGLTKFTKGEKYYMRLKERVFVGGYHIISSYARQVTAAIGTNMIAQYYDEATESGVNIYSTGAIPSQTGQFTTGAAHPFPQAIVGKYVTPGEASIINVGDSIDWGFADLQSNIPNIAGPGYFDRSTVDDSGVADICAMTAAIPGTTSIGTNVPLITQYLQYANILWYGPGVNDINTLGSNPVTSIYPNMIALWDVARAAGVKRIAKRGLLPYTSSTDSWRTLGNQTINPRFAMGGDGDALEAQMQAYVANGTIDAFYHVYSGVSDPTTRYAWLTDGTTSNWITSDGVHPDSTGYPLMRTDARAALLAEVAALYS